MGLWPNRRRDPALASGPWKLASQLADGSWQAHEHPHVYSIEPTSGPHRLVIAPRTGHVALMLDLAATWSEPVYFLLYLLRVSRLGNPPARYVSPALLDLSEVSRFIEQFGAFLETDGRHQFWIGSPAGECTLVYDQHNLIYAYGPLDRYVAVLERHGLVQAPVRLPVPHAHEYHAEQDEWERRILDVWAWDRYPLQPDDER